MYDFVHDETKPTVQPRDAIRFRPLSPLRCILYQLNPSMPLDLVYESRFSSNMKGHLCSLHEARKGQQEEADEQDEEYVSHTYYTSELYMCTLCESDLRLPTDHIFRTKNARI